MTALLEMMLALLATVGILYLGWLLLGKMLTPVGTPGAPMYIVVRGEGEGVGLEHTVNTLIWLRGKEWTRAPVLLLDDGLNEEGKAVAALLLKRWPELRLCGPEELANHMR